MSVKRAVNRQQRASTSAPGTALRFGIGLLAWSVAEYAVHRWIMHGSIGKAGRAIGRLVHPVVAEHLDHHRRPGSTVALRLDRHNVCYKAGAFGLATALVGTAFGTGFTVGYGAYTGLHDRIHHQRPRGRLATAVWNHHLEHHRLGRQGVDVNFGVSSSLWDAVFGTHPRALVASGASGQTKTGR